MEHVQWARLDEHDDPIITYPDSPQAFDALVEAVERGDNLSPHQEYLLREGSASTMAQGSGTLIPHGTSTAFLSTV